MFSLAASFFIIALLYATVGFGGGSSYIAMLAVAGVSHTMIPKISLICNLLVVSGGCYHYFKNGHLSRRLTLPFVLSSVPLAFLGGSFPLKEKTFFILLTLSLILCGIRILFLPDKKSEDITDPSFLLSLIVGGILGLLSGMVGIGGGIFLSPLIINMGWGRSKSAAATASVFILLNSLAGLAGQFSKDMSFPDYSNYIPLFLTVIVGGQIGSLIGSHKKISYSLIQKGTGVLTLFISIKLLMKIVS